MITQLPPKQDFGHFLANAINAYSQGSQQYQQNQTNKMLTELKLRDMLRKQKMTDAFTKLYDSLTGGSDTGTDVLPGLEEKPRISGIGPSGPHISLPKPKTQMDLISDIAAVAKQISELPEDSPQRKLAETTLMSLRKQLADMQGMEIKETPEVPPKSILGLDIPFTGQPSKTTVMPKQGFREDVGLGFGIGYPQGPYNPETSYGPQLQSPPVPAEEGKGSFWGLGPKVEMLKALARPQIEKAGVEGIGSELEKAYFPARTGTTPQRKPGKGKYKKPEAPRDPKERAAYDQLDWIRVPTSLQLEVIEALAANKTWNQIIDTGKLDNYLISTLIK